jgi:hypothetical protein
MRLFQRLRELFRRQEPEPTYRRMTPIRKKYALHAGEVVSVNDGDVHYIGAARLAALYGIPLSECIVWREGDDYLNDYFAFIHLYPRKDGDYRLPTR